MEDHDPDKFQNGRPTEGSDHVQPPLTQDNLRVAFGQLPEPETKKYMSEEAASHSNIAEEKSPTFLDKIKKRVPKPIAAACRGTL